MNLLRFDLYETQLWFLGMRWTLGIDALAKGDISAAQAGMGIVLRAFVPALVFIGIFLGVAYRYGRLYCGWLCPHFSVVETLNNLLHRACGKLSLWDRSTTPWANMEPNARWWPLFALSCTVMGFLWSITLVSYLLPPNVIWGGLVQGTLTPNQARFIVIGGLVFTAEFAFARHLFCRFGCAVGLFQSLAWMANPRGMVVAFARERARDCKTCDQPRGSACDNACPMRLNPRNIKRMMFSCVQCGQCLTACDTSQQAQQREPTLQWQIGADALRETLRQRRRDQMGRH
ncbi:MAG: 4Fe-4S binding protein [Rhodoferax sp.]|nr:4Fe-4S binding protein [Rhodoferax sp.]MDP3652324.1 4Fe-4S binding protein [Rhodoferax sp.]